MSAEAAPSISRRKRNTGTNRTAWAIWVTAGRVSKEKLRHVPLRSCR